VTAPAHGLPWRRRSPAVRALSGRVGSGLRWDALVLLATFGLAPPASAQLAPSATFTSNYIYRGVSLSDGEPTLELSLAYDDRSGFYAGGSLIGEVTRGQGAQSLGSQEYLGYAHRFGPDSTLDVGVSNLHYRSYGYGAAAYDATEVYAGWVRGLFNYYVHYSPNYFQPGTRALYGEVNGAVRLPRPWRLFGHAGVLTPLSGGYERYDVRAGVAAGFRHGEAQLSWSIASPSLGYGDRYSQGRGAVVLGLTWFF
jgi:uncharacterized protein (TIGR02001 family)